MWNLAWNLLYEYWVFVIWFIFSGQEKKLVEEVFNNAIDCLSDEDKTLPQVKNILSLHLCSNTCTLSLNVSTPLSFKLLTISKVLRKKLISALLVIRIIAYSLIKNWREILVVSMPKINILPHCFCSQKLEVFLELSFKQPSRLLLSPLPSPLPPRSSLLVPPESRF